MEPPCRDLRSGVALSPIPHRRTAAAISVATADGGAATEAISGGFILERSERDLREEREKEMREMRNLGFN